MSKNIVSKVKDILLKQHGTMLFHVDEEVLRLSQIFDQKLHANLSEAQIIDKLGEQSIENAIFEEKHLDKIKEEMLKTDYPNVTLAKEDKTIVLNGIFEARRMFQIEKVGHIRDKETAREYISANMERISKVIGDVQDFLYKTAGIRSFKDKEERIDNLTDILAKLLDANEGESKKCHVFVSRFAKLMPPKEELMKMSYTDFKINTNRVLEVLYHEFNQNFSINIKDLTKAFASIVKSEYQVLHTKYEIANKNNTRDTETSIFGVITSSIKNICNVCKKILHIAEPEINYALEKALERISKDEMLLSIKNRGGKDKNPDKSEDYMTGLKPDLTPDVRSAKSRSNDISM